MPDIRIGTALGLTDWRGSHPGMGCSTSKTAAGQGQQQVSAVKLSKDIESAVSQAGSALSTTEEITPSPSRKELPTQKGQLAGPNDSGQSSSSSPDEAYKRSPRSRYRLARRIGSGCSSQVFEAYHREEGTRCLLSHLMSWLCKSCQSSCATSKRQHSK